MPLPKDLSALCQRIPLFMGLNEDELHAITELSRVKRFEKGEVVFRKGEEAHAFFILLSGRVKLSKHNENGEEQVLMIAKRNDLFAEAAVFLDRPFFPATAAVIEDAVVIILPKRGLRDLLLSRPRMMLTMLGAFSERLKHLTQVVEGLSLKDASSRLARFLLDHADEKGVVHLGMTKQDLAAHLGIAPETLSRTLKRLREKKFLQDAKGSLRIINASELEKTASRDSYNF